MNQTLQNFLSGITGAAIGVACIIALPALAKTNGENLTKKVSPELSQGFLPNGAPVSFADLVETVTPAVVSIKVEREHPATVGRNREPNLEDIPEPFRRFLPPQPPSGSGPRMPVRAEGSGFVVDREGHIVTNNHVVSESEDITVIFSDGGEVEAKLIGRDPATDLALIKVDVGKPLSYVPFADEDELRVGDWVVAVGNPFGLGGTVTAGIVSARGREIASGRYNDFIQIDAPINQGNSGGPTFDLQGRVVGVNTLIFSPSGGNVGIGFAIPAATAKGIIAELKKEGEIARGYLGVNIQPITEEIAASMDLESTKGALVSQVLPDSPASKAGLEAGDIVLEVDGESVDDPRHMTQMVGAIKPGDRTKFRIIRSGKIKTIRAKIEKREEDGIPSQEESTEPAAAELGLALAPLDEDMRRRAGIDSDIEGVVITAVAPFSPAAENGLRPGDVILEVARQDVRTPDDVAAAIEDAKSKDKKSVLFFVQTRQTRRFVALSLNNDD
jgi:serine protease Do